MWSRRKKQRTFSGQKNTGRIRVKCNIKSTCNSPPIPCCPPGGAASVAMATCNFSPDMTVSLDHQFLQHHGSLIQLFSSYLEKKVRKMNFIFWLKEN